MSPAPETSGREGPTGGCDPGATGAAGSTPAAVDPALPAGASPGPTPSIAAGFEVADDRGTSAAGIGMGTIAAAAALAPVAGTALLPLPSLTRNDAGKSSRTTTPEIGQSVRLVTFSSYA